MVVLTHATLAKTLAKTVYLGYEILFASVNSTTGGEKDDSKIAKDSLANNVTNY